MFYPPPSLPVGNKKYYKMLPLPKAAKGGAKNVGDSTTKAAILSTVYILVADFIIDVLFYIG